MFLLPLFTFIRKNRYNGLMIVGDVNKGIQLINSNKLSEALSHFLMMEYDETDSEIFYYMGLCYTRLSDYESAVDCFHNSLQHDENLLRIFQTRMVLSYLYLINNHLSSAEFQLMKLYDGGYESPRLFSLMGYLKWRQGKVQPAIQFYKKAIAMEPDNCNALNSLGFILADNSQDLLEAEKACRRAVSINSGSPAYWDSLAWACYKQRKKSDALFFMRKALLLDSNNPVIKEHLDTITTDRYL